MTEATTAPRRPSSQIFRKTARVKLAPDHAKRQGEITKLAFLTLGSSEAAINLLNHTHADLGARPLDLATESDEGFAAVEQIIRNLAKPAPALS